MHCSPEGSGRGKRLQSNNAKNGTSTARDPFPHSIGGAMANSKFAIRNSKLLKAGAIEIPNS
jgi:hypothetical protein